ncbi:MAG: hypothetical protein ACT4PE_02820 [Candidatus Eiseniibacteriota bacterium]
MIGQALRDIRRCAAIVAAAMLLGAALPSPGEAALGLSHYGPRAGFSSDPDQFTIGFFGDWGELAPSVRVRTNGDLGFGDHALTFALNGDVAYHFTDVNMPVTFFAGGGLGYAFYNLDIDAPPGFDVDDTFNEIGLNLLVGVEKDLGGYKNGALELRFGLDDLPELKLTASLGFF